MSWEEEARDIARVLQSNLPAKWDGKESVRYLREHGYHWRQMEWIGWYFEFAARRCLVENLGGTIGPRFGNTCFDYARRYTWDLKAHSLGAGAGWAIMNDCEAILTCLTKTGGVGFVIATGEPIYDTDGSFKIWHDALKGDVSKFVREREKRGAPSRRRKAAFKLRSFELLYLSCEKDIQDGERAGWLGGFQKDMRNADGSPRREKFKIRIDKAPTLSFLL